MSEKQGRRDFDLNASELTGQAFVPPKSHNRREIEQLKASPPGFLIHKRERAGIRVAQNMLEFTAGTHDDTKPVIREVAGALFGGAYYNLFPRLRPGEFPVHERMRAQLKLPVMPVEAGPVTARQIASIARRGMFDTYSLATAVTMEASRTGAGYTGFRE